MEVNVLSNTEEKLYGRHAIGFTVSYEGKTPSREEVKVALCKKVNLMPDLTVITEIRQGFGGTECTGSAHTYSKKEQMDRFERKYLFKRVEKAAKKAAKPEENAEKAE